MSRIGRPPVPATIRFWRLVEKTETCWLWLGKKHKGGYGYFSGERKGIYAHRFSYELTNGPIPLGLTIDHLCRNTGCVNPEHLEAVTIRENILRGDGVAARNVRKVTCRHGHPLIEGNIIWRGSERVCRMCFRVAQRRWWRKRYGVPKERQRIAD